MTESRYRLYASFLRGSQGPLFALWVRPRDKPRDTGVLLVPPFAEEMNRSRRMLSLQARALAKQGFPTLMVDLFGTGDSAGEFAEASVQTWIADLHVAITALVNEGCSAVVVVALRFGTLLASELVIANEAKIKGLIFWQPVLNGNVFMKQFLRLRLAADLSSGSRSLTMQELQHQLSQGCSVDVAGYELSPQLYDQIQALNLNLLENPDRLAWLPITLMEVGSKGDDELSPSIRALRDRWAESGARFTIVKVVGDPFWQTPEITLAAELIPATVHAVQDMDGTG